MSTTETIPDPFRDRWSMPILRILFAIKWFINYNYAMIEIKQTETCRKWEHKLKDKKAKAAIAARLFRLANGLAGDVAPIGQGISELRIHYGCG